MGLIVRHSDGSEFINIPDKTYDETSTSLNLPGKGVLNWGQAYLNDFVHLLEHFASKYEPRSPQVGQIWYNTGTGELSVYTISRTWEVINKDLDIEAKFQAIIDALRVNNANITPPENPEKGVAWFDTTANVFKVFDGERWQSISLTSTSSYIKPENAKESDLWFDRNVKNLKVNDGKDFQRIMSSIEAVSAPTDVSVGQFWTNTSTGKMYVYKHDPVTDGYYWDELGADEVTEGVVFPEQANVGAFHIVRDGVSNILYVNKGTRTDPVWVEIPEFGGAISSVNEPVRVVDGMFWLDGNNVLKVRKSGQWVDIDETAISYVSDTLPENPKNGMLWFDTSDGSLKIRIDNVWKEVQAKGVINYGEAPSSPTTGQLWYDDVKAELAIFDGVDWKKVDNSSTIVSYVAPTDSKPGQLWLDTNTSEFKVNKNGRWAVLPEKARANLIKPENPVNGDMAYVDGKLQIFDGEAWKDINVQINNDVTNDLTSINYDPDSHEIVITNDGVVTRVPLAVSRDVVVENVGITSDVVEVIHPDIKEKERRIINIEKVNLQRPFFVFKNGQWIDNYKVDGQDLILEEADGQDEIVVLQLNGDISTNFLVKKFKSTVNGNFTIDNYTRTIEEQEEYDIIKAEYDAKLAELIAAHGDNSSEEDLTDEDKAILDEIASRFPVKESNNIADLSLGSVMVLKEGIFIPNEKLTINANNENKIVIPDTIAGEVYTVIQLIAGDDYKSAFFMRDHSFQIGAVEDNTESTKLNVKGKMMSDNLKAAPTDTSSYGEITVNYTFDATNNSVTFDLIDINPDYNFFVTRNNLYVPSIKYTVDRDNNTLTMHANQYDTIRVFQFYLPHNYVPVEFNYAEQLVQVDGWATLDLNQDFDLSKEILVFRNGTLQEKDNVNIITEQTVTDEEGNDYKVTGLRRVQVFGDVNTNDESIPGILAGDLVTVMQVSQPQNYNILMEEFDATDDGFNIFTPENIDLTKQIMVFKNGLKLAEDEYQIDDLGKITISDCNGVTEEELAEDPNAKGDKIVIFQFLPISDVADLTYTKEEVEATTTGSENFQLQKTDFIKDEFLWVFKNGQMLTRRQPDNDTTTQTQINTFRVFTERIYFDKTPAYDINGNPLYDDQGNQIFNVNPDNYEDVMAFNVDNVVEGEHVEIYEFNDKVTEVNNLTSSSHYEILPLNNIQRIYTSKFEQLTNLTMIFQDGVIIDRATDSLGQDYYRDNGMYRIYDQYAVENTNQSIIVNDWKVGGKIRVQQFTAKDQDIKTITLTVKIINDGTYDVFLPNGETYTPNAGAIEVYVDRLIQWSGEDYIEVANNRILFNKPLNSGQVVRMIVRK